MYCVVLCRAPRRVSRLRLEAVSEDAGRGCEGREKWDLQEGFEERIR